MVIKDGLKLSNQYTELISKVSNNIVSKSKMSHVIAEELRKLQKKLCTKNVTRWNSILFMIRSVLKLKPEDFKKIRDEMSANNATQKEIREKFSLNEQERELLNELKTVLEWFEFVTDELQSNKINISRIYPCVQFLKKRLLNERADVSAADYDNWTDLPFTKQLRKDLLASLDKRFSEMIKSDVFLVSSFLDPTFGIDVFDEEQKRVVQARLISLIKQQQVMREVLLEKNVNNEKQAKSKEFISDLKRHQNYNLVRQNVPKKSGNEGTIEDEIKDYIRFITDESFNCICPLLFWKMNETRFKELSKLAKKYLGVPASSAAVERMFSIAGHVFQTKRRKLGEIFFSTLVFLKLNEELLVKLFLN